MGKGWNRKERVVGSFLLCLLLIYLVTRLGPTYFYGWGDKGTVKGFLETTELSESKNENLTGNLDVIQDQWSQQDKTVQMLLAPYKYGSSFLLSGLEYGHHGQKVSSYLQIICYVISADRFQSSAVHEWLTTASWLPVFPHCAAGHFPIRSESRNQVLGKLPAESSVEENRYLVSWFKSTPLG